MALPPTIPTSFVPKQPVTNQPRSRSVSGGVFYYAGLFIAGVAVLGAGLTFGYEKYNESILHTRQKELELAKQNINTQAVEDFIRLRNRIRAANGLLNQHVTASQFFDVLEKLTLQNVRFQSLILSVGDDRTSKIEMHGTSRSFNALAAESEAFASDKRIKRAIFSGITVEPKTGAVNFAVRAELDPKLMTRSLSDVSTGTPANIATSTPIGPAITGTTTTSLPAAKAEGSTAPKATTTKP